MNLVGARHAKCVLLLFDVGLVNPATGQDEPQGNLSALATLPGAYEKDTGFRVWVR